MRVEGADFDADQILAEVPGIESLTIHNIRKKDLPRIQGLVRLPLKDLEIRWLSAPDLTEVPLPRDLSSLFLWHSRTRDLSGIERAPRLSVLQLRENSKLENLAPIRKLPALRRLSITGGFNGGQKIASLEALRGLKITALELNAIEGAKLDLSPVTTLPLDEVDIWGRSFAPVEVGKICAAFPDYYAKILNLTDYSLEGMRCKSCGGKQKAMFLRGRNFLWCPDCRAGGLAKLIAEFDSMVTAARTDLTMEKQP